MIHPPPVAKSGQEGGGGGSHDQRIGAGAQPQHRVAHLLRADDGDALLRHFRDPRANIARGGVRERCEAGHACTAKPVARRKGTRFRFRLVADAVVDLAFASRVAARKHGEAGERAEPLEQTASR